MMKKVQMKSKTIKLGAILLAPFVASIWVVRRVSSNVRNPATGQQSAGLNADTPPLESSRSALPYDQESRKNPNGMGKIGRTALMTMKDVADHMEEVLASAADDGSGKGSTWHEKLESWHTLLRSVIQTQSQADLFALVPTAAEFQERNREKEPLAGPIDDLRFWMGHLGYIFIVESGRVAAENNGSLDDRTAGVAISVFSVVGINSDPWPENESPPIDPAGILIARPEILQSLENLPINQLSFFLRTQSADTFFRRYEVGGDGMPALIERYRENRAALHNAFETLAKRAKEAQSGSER
jgi:hypothetical protein